MIERNGLFGYDETDDYQTLSKRDRQTKGSLFEDDEMEVLTNRKDSINEKNNRVSISIGGKDEQEFNNNVFYLPSEDEISGNETEKNNQLKLEVKKFNDIIFFNQIIFFSFRLLLSPMQLMKRIIKFRS